MENSVVVFMLIIATILIGLVAFGLSSVYASYQYNKLAIQNQAQNIANGLYISVSNKVGTNNGYTLFVVVNDFNYRGSLYFTVFYVPSNLENSSQLITPQFAYAQNGQIVYPKINTELTSVQASMLYFTNLNPMYQGTITLWQIPSLTSPASIVITVSPPSGYSPVILFFAQIQNKFVEVGYQWL